MGSLEEQIARLKLTAGEEPIIYQSLAKHPPQVPPKPKKPQQEVNKTPLVSTGSNMFVVLTFRPV